LRITITICYLYWSSLSPSSWWSKQHDKKKETRSIQHDPQNLHQHFIFTCPFMRSSIFPLVPWTRKRYPERIWFITKYKSSSQNCTAQYKWRRHDYSQTNTKMSVKHDQEYTTSMPIFFTNKNGIQRTIIHSRLTM
jgi:hypothetical protein